MIVRWPGMIKPDSQTSAIVQYEDITPTILNIAGGKPIDTLDGKSFLSVLNGSTNTARDYAYGMYNNIPEGPPYPSRSIRSSRYKLILNLTPEKTYSIKWYNTPGDFNLWQSWKEKAKTSKEAKFLVNRVSNRPAVEFFDLIKDPYELKNLASKIAYQKMIASFRLKLEQWMEQQGDKGAAVDRKYTK
jgi:N-sulfoglucosamine sulfohydrolase